MKLKALLVAGVVAGGLFASAAPAAAYCDHAYYQLTGYCNGCILISDVAYRTTGTSFVECAM